MGFYEGGGMAFRENQIVGQYRLIKELGRGSYKVVWKAERVESFRSPPVALAELINPDTQALEKEASLWVHGTGHPNVVPVHDVTMIDEVYVIVSEFVEGGTLMEWIEARLNSRPDISAIVEIIMGILHGLEHLHSKSIVHRDLKPANVLMQAGIPRISDFGGSGFTQTHGDGKSDVVRGTPAYMAPEMFEGEYSRQSDIWAVGVILYYMLAGVRPFLGQNQFHLARVIEKEPPPPMPDTAPMPLQRVVLKALKKKKEERYPTARAMRDALQTAYNEYLRSVEEERRRVEVQRRSEDEICKLAEQRRQEDERRLAEQHRIEEEQRRQQQAQRVTEQKRLDDVRRVQELLRQQEVARRVAMQQQTDEGEKRDLTPSYDEKGIQGLFNKRRNIYILVALMLLIVPLGWYIKTLFFGTEPLVSGIFGATSPQNPTADEKKKQKAEAQNLAGEAETAINQATDLLDKRDQISVTMAAERRKKIVELCNTTLSKSKAALVRDPQNLKALRCRTIAYQYLKQNGEAKKSAEEGLKLHPNDSYLRKVLELLK